jgi:hypothetical protein
VTEGSTSDADELDAGEAGEGADATLDASPGWDWDAAWSYGYGVCR